MTTPYNARTKPVTPYTTRKGSGVFNFNLLVTSGGVTGQLVDQNLNKFIIASGEGGIITPYSVRIKP